MPQNEQLEPLVSIIILNWNGFEVTKACIDSLLNISYNNYKIILVDNGSTDQPIESLSASFQTDVLDILPLQHNYGFTGGNNIGIKYACETYQPDYYLLLNNDTVVAEDFLTSMIQIFRVQEKCYAVVPKILYYDQPDVIWYAGGKINRLIGTVIQFGQKQKNNGYTVLKETTFMNGCCALLSKETIDDVGLLDEQFFAYSEDTDYSLRITKAGGKIYFTPNAIVYHKVSYSSNVNKGKWFSFYLATRNLILLQLKHLHWSLLPLFFLFFSVRWVAYLSFKHFLIRDYRTIRAIFNGLWDGLKNKLRYATILSTKHPEFRKTVSA